jgi:arabinogalactan oligomer / maltooligosaccharide transport system permease protein
VTPDRAGGTAIDLSDPRAGLPRARTTAGGLAKSLLLLGAALTFAIVVGFVGVVVAAPRLPRPPRLVGPVIGLVALVSVLPVIARRFAWIMPWYYVLPAIVFLLTFTFFPVLLTIWLAFTDYAGARNGLLNVATTTPIVAVRRRARGRRRPRQPELRRPAQRCVDVRAEVYSFESLPSRSSPTPTAS